MPIYVKQDAVKFRQLQGNEYTGNYYGIDTISDTTTEEKVAEINNAASSAMNNINSTATTANSTITSTANSAISNINTAASSAVSNVNNKTAELNNKVTTVQSALTSIVGSLEDPQVEFPIDTTLTISGAAADAKATGDAIGELKSAVTDINDAVGTETQTEITLTWYEGANGWDRRDKTGIPRQDTGYQAAYAVNVLPGEKYLLKAAYCNTGSNKRGYLVYTTDFSELLESAPVQEATGRYDFTVTIPENGGKLCINCCSSTESIAAETQLFKLGIDLINVKEIKDDLDDLSTDVTNINGRVSDIEQNNSKSPNCFILDDYGDTLNGLTLEKVDNSTIKITGTASARTRLYSANTLSNGLYCLSVTGTKNGIGIRYGSNLKTWDNGEPAEIPDESHIIIQIGEGTVCDNVVRVGVYAGRYIQPYVQGGKTVDDFVAREMANNAFIPYTGVVVEDNNNAAKWLNASARRVASESNPLLRLLHFTDPHNDVYHIRRIMQYSEIVDADDIVCTGDIAASYANATAFNGWNSVYGIENVLTVPGNHDWYANSTYTEYITQSDMELNLFSNADQWDATRPAGASYWYKDYAACNVRLIGLDSWLIYVDQTAYGAMMTWLANVLDDANTHGYHVLIINHAPPYTEDAVKIKCKFSNSLYNYGCGASSGGMDYQARQLSLPEISGEVETFISAGGHFIGYLFGHIHNDFVGKYINKGKQAFIVCGTANPSVDENNDVSRAGAGGDLFNIVTIDTNLNLIKIIRVGATKTLTMCERDAITINYDTQEVYGQETD